MRSFEHLSVALTAWSQGSGSNQRAILVNRVAGRGGHLPGVVRFLIYAATSPGNSLSGGGRTCGITLTYRNT